MSAVLDIRGLPETQKMLDEFSDREIQNKLRRAARAGIAEFRTDLRAVARSGDYPRSFSKTKTKTTTRGGASGHDIEAYVRPSSPLFNIFEPGAGEHEIAPRRGLVLAAHEGEGSWTSEGRKRGAAFFARGPVSHPGMKARPILPVAFARGLSRAETSVANAIFGQTSGTPVGS